MPPITLGKVSPIPWGKVRPILKFWLIYQTKF
jgi:hypothetical protein